MIAVLTTGVGGNTKSCLMLMSVSLPMTSYSSCLFSFFFLNMDNVIGVRTFYLMILLISEGQYPQFHFWFVYLPSSLFFPLAVLLEVWQLYQSFQRTTSLFQQTFSIVFPFLIPFMHLSLPSASSYLLWLIFSSSCSTLLRGAVLSHFSCVTVDPWWPMDCSPPGSSVHGILQARILAWVAMPSSRGSFPPRNWNRMSSVSCIACSFFTHKPPGKPLLRWELKLLSWDYSFVIYALFRH